MPYPKSKPLTSLEELVLYTLARQQLYGLEILEALNTERPFTPVRSGSLYPAIRRLVAKEYIATACIVTLPDAPDRIYYQITPAGQEILQPLAAYRQNLA